MSQVFELAAIINEADRKITEAQKEIGIIEDFIARGIFTAEASAQELAFWRNQLSQWKGTRNTTAAALEAAVRVIQEAEDAQAVAEAEAAEATRLEAERLAALQTGVDDAVSAASAASGGELAVRENAIAAQTIIEDLNTTLELFNTGQITETVFFGTVEDGNNQLAALGWPNWVPPSPPAPPLPPPDDVVVDPTAAALIAGLDQQGVLGALSINSAQVNSLTGLITEAQEREGLSLAAVADIHESPATPEDAAALLGAFGKGALAAIIALQSAGIIAETVSLGQIETVASALNKVADATGLTPLAQRAALLPLETGLFIPASQFWNSVHRPTISGLGQLVTELVREVIDLETFQREAGLQGLSDERSQRIFDAHWREIGQAQVARLFHLGTIDEEQFDTLTVINDFQPTVRPGLEISDIDMIKSLRKEDLGLIDMRRARKLGFIDDAELAQRVFIRGFEEDTPLVTATQRARAFEALQNAAIREVGKRLQKRQISEAEFLEAFDTIRGTFDERELWIARYRIAQSIKEPEEPGAGPGGEEAAENLTE